MSLLNDLELVPITIKSPKKIPPNRSKDWHAFKNIKSNKSIHYKNSVPSTDGLFCEKIFGK